MRQSFSLLLGPLARQARPPQQILLWPTPADQSVPAQPPLGQYVFRRGGFWQLLNRPALYPTPADLSVPNQPPFTPYVFRPGGFWQTQKALLYPTPAEQSVPDQPLHIQYVFRKGGLWQTTKFAIWPQLTDPVITPLRGGELGHVISDTWRGIGWINPLVFDLPPADRRAVFFALFAAGAITEEEFIALLASS